MDIQQGINYQFSRDGQQYGPYEGSQLVQMAQTGNVIATDHIWTEGMSEWQAASTFTQLAAVFAAASASANPAPISPTINMSSTPVSGSDNVKTAVDGTGTLRVDRKGVSGPGLQKANITSSVPTRSTPAPAAEPISPIASATQQSSTAGGHYSQQDKPTASFGLILLGFFLYIAGMIGGLFALFSTISALANAKADKLGVFPTFEEVAGSKGMIFWISLGVMTVGALICLIFTLIYVKRAWHHIQDLPSVTLSPGPAALLLLIPGFNLYWIFRAFYGWSKEYNLRCDIADPISSSRAHEGLFLTFCTMSVLGLAVFLYLPVMAKMCSAINVLAHSPDLEIDPNAGYSL